MNKLILPFFSILFFSAASAQAQATPTNNFISDIGGRTLMTKAPGFNIEGSYFYAADYKKATLIFGNQKLYQDIAVKLNLLDNEVIFQGANGGEMVVATPIKEIRFAEDKKVFKNGFPAIKNLSASTYYELIDTGKATLLKHYAVNYWDDKPYNSPTPTRTYEQKPEYFASVGGKMISLEKGSLASVLEAFMDKKEQVDGFIKTSGLKFKKEEDYILVFDFYNKL